MSERKRVEHYCTGEIECIDYIADQGWMEGFCLGNIVKYASRLQHKGTPVRDLEKIENYAVMLREWLEASATEVRKPQELELEEEPFPDVEWWRDLGRKAGEGLAAWKKREGLVTPAEVVAREMLGHEVADRRTASDGFEYLGETELLAIKQWTRLAIASGLEVPELLRSLVMNDIQFQVLVPTLEREGEP
jgi:hypothetical protein